MKTGIDLLKIFILCLVMLGQTSCSKDPGSEIKSHPIIGQWMFSSSKYHFPLYPYSGDVPDFHFADTASVRFINASTFTYTWAKNITYSQPPLVTWGTASATYSITQDSVLNLLPKKFSNPFYLFLCKPFPNLTTDTTDYVSSFKLIDPDRLVIVTYYPRSATANNYVGYDSTFFTRKK
jgi:hypothetical protein